MFFQLAFGAYLGAFFNLNPFLDRDGYKILVDVLHEPGLRQRARQQFAQRLSGSVPDGADLTGARSLRDRGNHLVGVGAGIAVIFSTRYYHRIPRRPPISW